MSKEKPSAASLESPALKEKRDGYPPRFGGRVPWKIRMLKSVWPDFCGAPNVFPKASTVLSDGVEYECWVNSYGAVAGICKNGFNLGVKPDEFEVAAWHGDEDVNLKIYADNPPSETFERAFSSTTSGCLRTCECGRVTFDTNGSYDWNEGELEALEKKAKEEPDNYIAVDYSVPSMHLQGKEWVVGCKCNYGTTVQAFIDRHAEQIAAYLNRMAEEKIEQAAKMKVKA